MPRSPAKSKSRTAIVTGGASGIGLATVEVLLRDGWRVAVFDRDEKSLATVRRRFTRNKNILVSSIDVTDEPSVTNAVAAVAKQFRGLHGVVNCAGIAADIPALDTPVDLFRRILDINVLGSFIVARAAARLMRQQKIVDGERGAIVNLASISGLRGSKGRVAYGASKGAVVTMTQVLANDLAGDKIRVNCVAPGPVETAMVAKLHTDTDRGLFRRFVPMDRYATPSEIAEAITFLLDARKASYITGEILAVDGGFRGAGLIAGRE